MFHKNFIAPLFIYLVLMNMCDASMWCPEAHRVLPLFQPDLPVSVPFLGESLGPLGTCAHAGACWNACLPLHRPHFISSEGFRQNVTLLRNLPLRPFTLVLHPRFRSTPWMPGPALPSIHHLLFHRMPARGWHLRVFMWQDSASKEWPPMAAEEICGHGV